MKFPPLILALSLVILALATGCISDEDLPAPVHPASPPADGVLIQAIGDVTGQGVVLEGVPRGTLDTITLTIGLAPGVKTLDLNNLTVVYADAVRTEIFQPVPGYRGNPPPGYWGILGVAHELGNPNMRLDFEEEFTLRLNPKAPIVPNQVMTISIRPMEGKALILRRVAPSSIVAEDNVLPAL